MCDLLGEVRSSCYIILHGRASASADHHGRVKREADPSIARGSSWVELSVEPARAAR